MLCPGLNVGLHVRKYNKDIKKKTKTKKNNNAKTIDKNKIKRK